MKFLRTLFAALLFSVAAFATPTNTTTNSDVRLEAVDINNNTGVQYFASNSSDRTLCMYFTVDTADNVAGSVVNRVQLEPGQINIYVGRFDRINSYQAWRSYVRFNANWGGCSN